MSKSKVYCFSVQFHTMDNKYHHRVIFAESVPAAAWFGYQEGKQWGDGTCVEIYEYLPNIIDKKGRNVHGFPILEELYNIRIDHNDPPTFDDIWLDDYTKPRYKIKHSSLSKKYGSIVPNGQ